VEGCQLRLILFIAVIALMVDAYVYSGAHTRSAYTQVAIAARHLVAYIGEVVDVGTEREGSRDLTRI
jgi:hypothetical protein